ncbi:hypothetical protein PQC39_gp027 [Vibrio phage Vp_R1]|uniref:WYL domain-containing protein n=1 Tax=Vibrio phage Vp_R1 TaxID=2059867 RepID=A0A2H5BPX9_9CAUD|nr:hypothetical protein PQC39_gp027 [Vibrio phage Vp_R1]AUG88391.1 hypothetical protein VPR_027 [Vibrio phage Vp_R1]
MGLGLFNNLEETCGEKELRFVYKNYKGEYSERRVIPIKLEYQENNEYHGNGWILVALDLDKNSEREFLVTDIVTFL